MQFLRQSLCLMQAFSGSIQSSTASAYDSWLAVNAKISQCLDILLRKLIAQGLMVMQAFAIEPFSTSIGTMMSQGLLGSYSQWIRVSSMSRISVFFPMFSLVLGMKTFLSSISAKVGEENLTGLLRTFIEKSKCSKVLGSLPSIAALTLLMQQLLIFSFRLLEQIKRVETGYFPELLIVVFKSAQNVKVFSFPGSLLADKLSKSPETVDFCEGFSCLLASVIFCQSSPKVDFR